MRFAELGRPGPRAPRGAFRGVALAGFAGLVGLVTLGLLGTLLPLYWVYLLSTVAVGAIIARGIGVLTNQAGIITLCQMSFAAIGGWVVSWLALTWPSVPFPLLVVIGGVVTTPVGLLLGLVTVRIRGVELAVVTLGFSAALDLVLRQGGFPGVGAGEPVIPAPPFDDSRWYFALAWAFFIVLQIGIAILGRTRVGLGWTAVRTSERAAAALGVPVGITKSSAFAVGALCSGIAGGMLAGQYGLLTTSVFAPVTSMVHLATAVLCGASLFGGALLAGVFTVCVPEVLRRVGLPLDVGNALLALGALDVLRRGTGGIAEQLQSKVQDRVFRGARTSCEFAPMELVGNSRTEETVVDSEAGAVSGPSEARLEILGLAVSFGGNRALDAVTVTVRAGEVHALIGPNGAGKSTLVDAATGFLAAYDGTVRLSGQSIDGMPAHVRARRGIRRTFQHSRAILSATVSDYFRLAAPESDAGTQDVVRRYFGIPTGKLPVRLLDVGSRRILEIAAAIAARPSVILLDEPAAGLGERERVALAARIRRLPLEFGCAVLLIEHDMEFVRAAATSVTVLEEGRVIAHGPAVETLDSPRVIDAYLGAAVT